MLEFGSQGSSSPQKLLHFEVLNIQMYPDTSMAGIGWTRNALATPSSRFTTSPSADSCRFMRTIALHTRDKPRILFHKCALVWTTWILLNIQHTCYKPLISSIDNVLHWTYDRARPNTTRYVVCAIAHAVTWRKYIRIFSWSKVVFAESCSKDSSLFVANISLARTLDHIHILHHTSTDHILLLGKSS